jgi:HEPN domain-containing protein
MAVDVVREWLDAAELDLRTIRNCLWGPDPTAASAAYHCQQASEKLVKAVLISIGIHPPKSHNIHDLVRMIEPSHPLLPTSSPLARLTPFAWAFRYPSGDPDMKVEPSVEHVATWLGEIVSAMRAFEQHRGASGS